MLGLLIITILLTGLNIPVRAFSLKNADDLLMKVVAVPNLTAIAAQYLFTYAIGLLGTWVIGKLLRATLTGFPVVFGLTLLALLLAGNKPLKYLNLEAVIFSLCIGLAVGNLTRLPDWLRAALATELWVNIGLVLLGTSVIFGDVLKAGSLGNRRLTYHTRISKSDYLDLELFACFRQLE